MAGRDALYILCLFSKTVLHITLMAAELPTTVTVQLELLSTLRTLEMVVRFPVHQLKVGIPPLVPALITTKTFPFTVGGLMNHLPAVLTICTFVQEVEHRLGLLSLSNSLSVTE